MGALVPLITAGVSIFQATKKPKSPKLQAPVSKSATEIQADQDRLRLAQGQRRGRSSTILGGAGSVGLGSVGTKTLLGE